MLMSPEKFAREFMKLAHETAFAADSALVERIEDVLMAELPALTPEDTGTMRRAWKRVPWKKAGVGGVLNDADPTGFYPQIIDRGRRRSKKSRRMLGSLKAKRGVARPMVRRIRRDLRAYADATIGKVLK